LLARRIHRNHRDFKRQLGSSSGVQFEVPSRPLSHSCSTAAAAEVGGGGGGGAATASASFRATSAGGTRTMAVTIDSALGTAARLRRCATAAIVSAGCPYAVETAVAADGDAGSRATSARSAAAVNAASSDSSPGSSSHSCSVAPAAAASPYTGAAAAAVG
jgi:hypothetical protein